MTNEPTASTVTVNLDHPMCVTSDEGDRSYVPSTISKPISNNLNTKAVWGAISAGIGQFPLEEVFALMDLYKSKVELDFPSFFGYSTIF